MIFRPNYDDVSSFLAYHRDTLQHEGKTIDRYWVSLRPLLKWADATPFPEIKGKRPTFPAYMVAARNERDEEQPLSVTHSTRILSDSRAFLAWARVEWPSRYRELPQSWIDSLRLPRAKGLQSELKEIESYTLEEVQAIAALPVSTVAERRNQAAISFLYISAMRAGAFITLPIDCVDLAERKVYQLPTRGVATKNSKAAVTSLLPIPELLRVVEAWDAYVNERLPGTGLWFPRIDLGRGDVTEETGRIGGRRNALAEGIHSLCERAGIPFRSAHKLRHGHALYGIRHARDIEDLKAVSQTMMHSSLAITDGIYGRLAADNVAASYGRMKPEAAGAPTSRREAPQTGAVDQTAMLMQLLERFREDPAAFAALLGSGKGN